MPAGFSQTQRPTFQMPPQPGPGEVALVARSQTACVVQARSQAPPDLSTAELWQRAQEMPKTSQEAIFSV